jgi:hypothetical protein
VRLADDIVLFQPRTRHDRKSCTFWFAYPSGLGRGLTPMARFLCNSTGCSLLRGLLRLCVLEDMDLKLLYVSTALFFFFN